MKNQEPNSRTSASATDPKITETTVLLNDENYSGENYYTIATTEKEDEIDADAEVGVDLEDNQNTDEDSSEPNNEYDWFKEVFQEISGIALPMGLSFTFCFEVFLAVILLQLLSESDEETAAATLVSTYMNTICILAFSPMLSGAMHISKQLGKWRELEKKPDDNTMGISVQDDDNNTVSKKAQKKERIETLHINLEMIAAATTIPATIALAFSKPILISALGQDEAVATFAAKFLRVYAIAPVALMPRGAIDQVLFGMGEARAAMWMGFGALSIGATLSVLLGFGVKMGSLQFPEMREEGVALGFAVEAYLTLISHGLYLKFQKECKEFDFYKVALDRIRRNLNGFKKLLSTSGSITFTTLLDLGASFTVGIFSGLLGSDEQAAMSYCMQIIFFEFIMAAAFSFSCSQEVSRLIGAKNFIKVEKIATYGLTTSFIYLTPLPIFFAAYPRSLEFIGGGATDEIHQILKKLVPIMAAGTIIETGRFNILQQLRALEDLIVPNMVAFGGMVGGIGLSAALGFGTSMGIYGVATGYTAGIGITAAGLFVRWRYQIKELLEKEKAKAANNIELQDKGETATIIEDDKSSDVTIIPQPSVLETFCNRFSFFSPPKNQITSAQIERKEEENYSL
jgi:Na+-driven multidrug efflux pump